MVFNVSTMNSIDRDAGLIRNLGGPTKVAEAISADKRVSAQRVQNWLTRGIPSNIKVLYPHLFMPELAQAPSPAPVVADTAQGVA